MNFTPSKSIGKEMKTEKFIASLVISSVASYILAVLFLARLNPGYNHYHNLVSELGRYGAPYNYVLNIVLMISGISIIALAGIIYKLFSNSRTLIVGCISLALFGASVVLGGVFPCDQNCLVPISASGYLHAITGMPAMITAPLSFILIGKLFKSEPHFISVSKPIYWLGILSIFAMIASVAIFPYFNLIGLGQRIAAFFQLAVPFIIAYKLFDFHISIKRI